MGKKLLTTVTVVATILWAMGLAAFLPLTASAATLSGGELIKASGAAVYYYGMDGKRYVFPNETTYKTWYADFSSVTTITDAELAAVPIGGNVTFRAGTYLVKITTDPKVYAVEPGGKLRWVETESVASTLYGSNWATMVRDVPDAFFVNYTSGSSISAATYPTGSLVKEAGSSDVYYIDGTTKRKIANASAMSANWFQDKFVQTATTLGAYTAAAEVSGKDSGLTNVAGSAAVATGPLTLTLASDTPGSSSVAANASANFTKVTFAAGANAVNITSIYVTRYGLTGNSDLENVKLVNSGGANVGSIGSFNTNGKALLTFSPALSIAANSSATYFIRAGIVTGTASGLNAALGIDSASDIVSNAASVAGSFPIKGNAMTTTSVTIGSASVTNDGSVTDSTPDAGDTNVVVNRFKVTAGSTEDITIESLSFSESGTASLSDTKNIELYSTTQAKSLGEVASWSSDGKATFSNLALTVTKGNIHRFEVRLDVTSGAGLTVNADLSDGSDVMMNVKGASYGFYITPSVTGSWNGQGASSQTINSGSLVVSKSASTPATGNIAAADDQELTTFDFEAKGEEVKISSLKFSFDLTSGFVDGTDEGQITNVKVWDENGQVVAGPKDLTATNYTANGTTYEATVTYTDLIIVPVGTHKYTVSARLANDTSTNDALVVGIADADTDITAKGLSTNDTVSATPAASNVNGNTQTVKAGTLSATTLTQPAARSIATGIQDYVWMTASLDASNSGEDVQITAMVVEDTVADSNTTSHTAGFADLKNAELWADLTSANSSRGDIYETKISSTEQPTGSGAGDHTLTFTLSQTLTVKKDTFVKVAMVADLASFTPDGVETHTVSLDTDASDVTATGADTGTSLSASVTPTGAGQLMTAAASGTLTLTVDSSSPSASLVSGNSTGATLAVFRLAANNVEDLDLDSVKITDDGADDGVVTYYFYSSKRADGGSTSSPIASKAGGATAEVFLNDGTVTIPADSYVTITVKGDVAGVDGTTVANGDTVIVTVAASGDIDTTGKAAGSGVDSTATSVDAATHTIFKSYPTIKFASDTPSGALAPSANTKVAKIAVTAASGDDITWDGAADPDGGDEDDSITISVASSRSDDDTVTEIWTLKDGDGNTLDTVTADVVGNASNEITFDFTTKDFVVPAGQTKYLEVYVNTLDLETANDSIQIWLNDAPTGTALLWSINYDDGDYSADDIIFRGDIYGGTLKN